MEDLTSQILQGESCLSPVLVLCPEQGQFLSGLGLGYGQLLHALGIVGRPGPEGAVVRQDGRHRRRCDGGNGGTAAVMMMVVMATAGSSIVECGRVMHRRRLGRRSRRHGRCYLPKRWSPCAAVKLQLNRGPDLAGTVLKGGTPRQRFVHGSALAVGHGCGITTVGSGQAVIHLRSRGQPRGRDPEHPAPSRRRRCRHCHPAGDAAAASFEGV